jgi:D-beta-D-heptose 7-phosphate kinase/D-beta-D-heptose 1-phosphate adenosyltransferase
MNVVLVTGGFDPIHSGHIKYLKTAKSMGDTLIVGVNSDAWLTRKKGRPFLPLHERLNIIQNLNMVDYVIEFDDSDGSARKAIGMVRAMCPLDTIIFANGGDRTRENIPEMDIQDNNLEFAFGVGGEDKSNSSSWILEEWKLPKTVRQWGYYRVLFEPNKQVKLKELTVLPGQKLSMQRHQERKEFWFVSEGQAAVYSMDESNVTLIGTYNEQEYLHIGLGQWHRLCNETDKPLKIIEIQYGSACYEEDIERKNV